MRANVVRADDYRHEAFGDEQRLETLVHYIVYKCSDPKKLGATKLNKILWYSDITAFLHSGKGVSGAKYIKLQHGPVPQNIDQVKQRLQASGAIAIRREFYFDHQQEQAFAITQPDLSHFSGPEISMVDGIMNYICENHTATSISEATHNIIWEAAEIGEEIPLYTIFAAQKAEVTPDDIAWALNEAKKKGLANI